jgi:hypothetical protein
MKHAVLLLMIGLLALAAASAGAQAINKGGFSGTLFTQTAVVPNNSSVDIYVTPSGNKALKFILTQVCLEPLTAVDLTGTTMGKIIVPDLPDHCVTFIPGLAIPRGETLTFTESAGGGDTSVMIIGILSKK